jgi:nicotinamide-nucleotide amidase
MLAEIITVGDELLLGQTIDTNSAWMGEHLALLGVGVKRITAISDEPEALIDALDLALESMDLVLITGGLGPTQDDRTKQVLADYFHSSLVMNEDVLEKITAWFSRRGLPMLPSNVDQALLPDSCEVLSNPLGTAQGMWFGVKEGPQTVISMPGVPYEMKGIMTHEVFPRLSSRFALPTRYHRTILTQGVGESYLSKHVASWEADLANRQVSIAYLPAPGQVRVRLSAAGLNREEAILRVETEVEAFKVLCNHCIVTDREGESVAEALVRVLIEAGKTLGVAESCTGGAIAGSITAIAGSSECFLGGVVAYSNKMKVELLGVPEELIQTHGAVSEPVVKEMANGLLLRTGADYALSTSGIAGPGGGTIEKPVGTVWMALAGPRGVHSRHVNFGESRVRNIEKTRLECQAWLLRELKGLKSEGE